MGKVRKGLNANVRAERRRCLRIVDAFIVSYRPLQNEAGMPGETARARINMAHKIYEAIDRGQRS